jgi:radical SAM enzyme (TIGR01210 family)
MSGPGTEASDRVTQALSASTSASGKTYAFDDRHDPRSPIGFWFQESDDGLVLFAVFYGLACRWSCCTSCNLPSKSSSRSVPYADLIAQIDSVFSAPEVEARRAEIRKLIVSNNGSVLDEVTFPSTALMHLVVQANLRLPGVRVFSLESRPEYADLAELEFLSRAMRERPQPAEIEIAIGFEAFNDRIRNDVFRKGLSLGAFEALVDRICQPGFRLKCYFMQKPVPELSDEAAVDDIRAGIDYLHQTASRSRVRINMHLNPTYVAHGTPLAQSFRVGAYQPPQLRDVVRALLHARGKSLSIFVGLDDEGLAVSGGSFRRPGDEQLAAQIEAFNRTQDFNALETWCRARGLLP